MPNARPRVPFRGTLPLTPGVPPRIWGPGPFSSSVLRRTTDAPAEPEVIPSAILSPSSSDVSRPASIPCSTGFIIALSLLLVTPLRAQELDSLPAGVRLRATLQLPSRTIIGTLVRADSAGLVVAPAGAAPSVFLDFYELRRLERSLGALLQQ